MTEFIALIIFIVTVFIIALIFSVIVEYFDNKRMSNVNKYINNKNKSLKDIYLYARSQGYSEENALLLIQKIKLFQPDRK